MRFFDLLDHLYEVGDGRMLVVLHLCHVVLALHEIVKVRLMCSIQKGVPVQSFSRVFVSAVFF